jgi:hypothetical protein
MLRFRSIIIVNAVLVLLFVASNYVVWDMVNSNPHLGHTSMNAFNIVVSSWGDVVEGTVERIDGMSILPNLPFWLFFVAVALNLYFIYKLSRASKVG